jgi:hypothetical protein
MGLTWRSPSGFTPEVPRQIRGSFLRGRSRVATTTTWSSSLLFMSMRIISMAATAALVADCSAETVGWRAETVPVVAVLAPVPHAQTAALRADRGGRHPRGRACHAASRRPLACKRGSDRGPACVRGAEEPALAGGGGGL